MGTPGVPWNPSKDIIVNILKECKGVISKAAKKFEVAPLTLYRKINADPELVQLLKDLREDYETVMLDMAENCVSYAMSNMTLKPDQALKASFFVLNSKGKTRGWNNTFYDNQQYSPALEAENYKMENLGLKELVEKQKKELDDLRNKS